MSHGQHPEAGALPTPRGGSTRGTSTGRSTPNGVWTKVTASIGTGQYVDPNAGRITFGEYAEQWRAAQVHRPNSQAHVETMPRRHACPMFGETLAHRHVA
ncbi:hypothetical protein [Nocardioides terrigena]|uniref:hypothetical protein n=1 Tax=Nocardioides terrigena TaxID=424797 RepID=UPI0018FFF111|nr:hypothetical protein [Nocardioides terrigena]